MGRCVRCGRKVLLGISKDGLCKACVYDDEVEAARQLEICKEQLLGLPLEDALASPVVYAGLGKEKLQTQLEACQAALDGLKVICSNPQFINALKAVVVKSERVGYDFRGVWMLDPERPNSAFDNLEKKLTRLISDCQRALPNAYDYSKVFRVVGVTFKNGRKSRQTILRHMKFKDPPYNREEIDMTLEPYKFEDEDAVGVYVEGEQVGNISRNDLPWLLEHWKDYKCISEFAISGSSDVSYGLEIRACFVNS